MSAFTTLIQHSIGSPSHSSQTRRRNKRHPNWKEGSKTVIICNKMILYIKSPKDHQKLLDLINECGKVEGYKIYIQKSMVLYINNELSERETRKEFHLLLQQQQQ